MRRLLGGALVFLTAPASGRPLAFLRIGLCVVLLIQAWALWANLDQLFGCFGLVQWSVAESIAPDGVPRVGWISSLLGLDPATSLHGLFLLYVMSLVGLLVGWRTGCMTAIAWLTHLALMTSGRTAVYGVDALAHVTLFYFLWLPVSAEASIDRLAGRVSGAASWQARLGLRIMQLHLCVVYFAAGVLKAPGEDWQNGEAIWRALMCRDLAVYDFSWLAEVPYLVWATTWATLVVEIGYAFFVWPRRTRTLWVLAVIGLHLGIAVTMGLWSFSGVMIVLNVGAFLVSPEPTPAQLQEVKPVAPSLSPA
jgi:hypothetical protein